MCNRLVIGGWVMLGIAAFALAQSGTPPRTSGVSAAKAAAPAAAPAAARSSAQKIDEQAIRQIVTAFTKAYNAGDAKGIAALFTADGEVVDEDNTRWHGREAVQGVFAEVFKAHPKAQIEIAVESIRFLSPVLALEEGVSTVKHEPGKPGESGHYLVTHVKQDGRWQMASARDLADDESTASSELEQLGWLVGSWVDEDAEGLVRTKYQWTANRRYIVGDFTLQVAGKPALSGSQRIGWDPLAKKIRSWVFDSEGGFGESFWTRDGNDWIVKMSGVTRDGRQGSATSVYTRLGPDKYMFSSRDRVFGNEISADIEPVIVAREPPEPAKKSAK